MCRSSKRAATRNTMFETLMIKKTTCVMTFNHCVFSHLKSSVASFFVSSGTAVRSSLVPFGSFSSRGSSPSPLGFGFVSFIKLPTKPFATTMKMEIITPANATAQIG